MLGRLCRWLRCLGVDAEFINRRGPCTLDSALITSRAVATGRVFLTRDARLAARRDCSGSYLLRSDDAGDQLAEVAKHFNVTFDER